MADGAKRMLLLVTFTCLFGNQVDGKDFSFFN